MSITHINTDNYDVTSDTIANQINDIVNAGGTAKVQITKSSRSLSQNALMHMWFTEISAHLIKNGREYCTVEWVKQALKATFLGSEQVASVDVLTGEKIATTEIRHTHNLDKGEATFFLQQVQSWALDINLILTAPIDSQYMKFLQEQVET